MLSSRAAPRGDEYPETEAPLGPVLVDAVRALVRDEAHRTLGHERVKKPRALLIRAVMEATSLSRSILTRREQRGTLKLMRVGRRVPIATEEVERRLEGRR